MTFPIPSLVISFTSIPSPSQTCFIDLVLYSTMIDQSAFCDVEFESKELEVESKREKTASSDSVSCRSSITTSEGASDAAYSHRLQVVAAATTRYHEMKLKVARRHTTYLRSKSTRFFNH
ncbi:hypothetical protein Droror1_Dr00002667 [Drosera rotundifolia]